MDFVMKLLKLDWWIYVSVVLTFFIVALFLNYVVKKINETRLEERFVRIQNKVSNNQSIQVQRRAESRMLSRTPLEIVLEQSNPPTVKGVSLVFDKNDNSNELNKNDKIDIKNFPLSKCLHTAEGKDSSGNVEAGKASENEIAPAFLGKIYKELCVVERSKSLSNAEKDNVKDIPVVNYRKQESKSTSSVKKLLENQKAEDSAKRLQKTNGESFSASDHKQATSVIVVEK